MLQFEYGNAEHRHQGRGHFHEPYGPGMTASLRWTGLHAAENQYSGEYLLIFGEAGASELLRFT